MSDVIKLRQQRKVSKRTEKEKAAQQNRLLHGQTKGEKQRKKLEHERAARHIDGHRKDPDDKD